MMLLMCFMCVLVSESFGIFFGTLFSPVVSMKYFLINLSIIYSPKYYVVASSCTLYSITISPRSYVL
jgi:hypothetical protein